VHASIDVGSNTVRLLIGEVVAGQIRPSHYERYITRLKGGQTDKGLAPEAMERTLHALSRCSDTIRRYQVESVIAFGTEALRTASNATQFIDNVKRRLNLDLQIISGEHEARTSAAGVLSALQPCPESAIIIDIGGGSTEFIIVEQGKVVFQKSTPLGVVRIAEAPDSDDRSSFIGRAVESLKRVIAAQGFEPQLLNPSIAFVGTAGTITTLAAMDMEMAEYDWRKVNNHQMHLDRIIRFRNRLAPLTTSQREAIPGMEKGRGDLIIPGIDIVLELMSTYRKKTLTISDFGLLEGILLQMADPAAFH